MQTHVQPPLLIAAHPENAQGLKVAVIEGHDIGGTCVNRGCVPSKALLAASGRVREFRDTQHLKAMGIQVQPLSRHTLCFSGDVPWRGGLKSQAAGSMRRAASPRHLTTTSRLHLHASWTLRNPAAGRVCGIRPSGHLGPRKQPGSHDPAEPEALAGSHRRGEYGSQRRWRAHAGCAVLCGVPTLALQSSHAAYTIVTLF